MSVCQDVLCHKKLRKFVEMCCVTKTKEVCMVCHKNPMGLFCKLI
jgi:hypothetical protein